MKYPATFTPETGGFFATFRDIPEAITQGDKEQEALDMVRDALLTAMNCYFEDRRPVPAPSKAKPGERMISLVGCFTCVMAASGFECGKKKPAF